MRTRSEPVEERAALRERLLDVPWQVPRPVWYGRLGLLAVVAIWATSVLLSRMTEPPTVRTPAEFTAFVQRELKTYSGLVKRSGATPD